ncbi:MAG: hypothetical protein JXR39_09275 [Marinilabiliaceae bacterium]|nr:hypothetical protein [Marinilabiliaceae bacterium]
MTLINILVVVLLIGLPIYFMLRSAKGGQRKMVQQLTDSATVKGFMASEVLVFSTRLAVAVDALRHTLLVGNWREGAMTMEAIALEAFEQIKVVEKKMSQSDSSVGELELVLLSRGREWRLQLFHAYTDGLNSGAEAVGKAQSLKAQLLPCIKADHTA